MAYFSGQFLFHTPTHQKPFFAHGWILAQVFVRNTSYVESTIPYHVGVTGYCII